MKKYIIIPFIIFVLIVCNIIIVPKKKDTIKVAEVAHSIFYAPMYVAIDNGYFKDEGIDIELILTPGADKVSAAVMSGDANIGFAGVESTIYIYNNKESDYLKTFAGLTKKDGQFIVSRKKDDFKFDNLKGKEVVVGRIGGMPSLNFISALSNNDIKENDVNINYSIDYAALSGAFISGVGDYVNLFEPNATLLEKQGLGYIVSSVGKYSNEVPYTAYFAKKSFIENNKELINKFRKSINKGLDYVKNHEAKDIASIINKDFNDTSLNDLITIIQRYKDADVWQDNTFVSEYSFNNLQDLLIKGNLIKEYVSYNDLVINE